MTKEATRVLGDHRELLGNLRNHHGQMARHLQDLDQLALERGEKDKAYKLVGRLAETAKGKNGGKLTFERYVLAAMLDRVLRVANEHLARMTGGRYRLQRAQYVDDKRTRGGLDLDVYDFHTGDPRSAGTLSGGEGFQASLSLALGMADCVQSQAGGIHLEAIFVDEGFGTLGASDLDAVMKVLEGLREGGRLVGVISHIKLLKERIHARLEVDKGVAGSEARFGIP